MARPFTLLFFLFILVRSTWCARALDTWVEAPRPTGSGAPISVTFGKGMFVAGGLQGSLLTSTNGVDWAKQDSTITTDINRVKFVNDRFFAFSNHKSPPFDGVTLVSSEGVEWTALTSSVLADITYGNGAYFAVHFAPGPIDPGGFGSVILTSLDLTQWTPVGNAVFDDIGFGGGIFVARVDNPGSNIPLLSYSTDAKNWTKTGASSTLNQFDSEITYQNGVFSTFKIGLASPTGCIACPEAFEGYALYVSNNGRTWFNGFYVKSNFTPLKMAVGGNFYVVPAGKSIFYSSKLADTGTTLTTNWTRKDFAISKPETGVSDVVFGNDMFVAVTFGKIFVSNPVIGAPPFRFVEQPQPQTANAGGTVSLSVVVQGSDPITYQWRRSGTNIAGATARIFTLANLAPELAGEYDVVVTNPSGTATSEKAIVTVLFAYVHFYAGVSLSGNPGDKFLLEYQDQLESAQWQAAGNVTLTNDQSVWFDADSLAHPKRFYRATYQGR